MAAFTIITRPVPAAPNHALQRTLVPRVAELEFVRRLQIIVSTKLFTMKTPLLLVLTITGVCASLIAAEPVPPPEPEALAKLRAEYLDKAAAAVQPLREHYVKELMQLEQSLASSGDVPGAAKVHEERIGYEKPPLVIVKATWGTPSKTTDVTQQLQALVQSNKLDVVADGRFTSVDPAPGLYKQAVISYRQGGTEKKVIVAQPNRILLP